MRAIRSSKEVVISPERLAERFLQRAELGIDHVDASRARSATGLRERAALDRDHAIHGFQPLADHGGSPPRRSPAAQRGPSRA
jgi:hypothetical protein